MSGDARRFFGVGTKAASEQEVVDGTAVVDMISWLAPTGQK